MSKFYTLILLLLISNAAPAQPPTAIFRHLTTNNGLPVNYVTALAQDSMGFIWIGTSQGLFRFDGFNYEAFSSSIGKQPTFHSNYIYKLYTDSKGRLWIATTDKGLSLLEPGKHTIEQVLCSPGNKSAFLPVISDIKEDGRGFIYFATNDGLLRLSPDGKTWDQYKTSEAPDSENRMIQITVDGDGRLLVGGIAGLFLFDPIKAKFVEPDNDLQVAFKKSTYFRSVIYHQDKIWFSTWLPDLAVFDVKLKKISYHYSPVTEAKKEFKKTATVFFADHQGNLWIGTEKGLHFVASGNSKIYHTFLHDPANSYSIVSNKVSCLLQDREGNLWVGTNDGISISQLNKNSLINYSVNAVNNYPFGNKQVSDVAELDDKGYLIGTTADAGLYQTDKDFKVKRKYYFGDIQWDGIWYHYKDEKTKLVYIVTYKGILEYDQKSKQLRKSSNRFLLSNAPFSSIVKLSDDEVWLSRFRNIFYRYNLRTGKYKQYQLTDFGEPPQVIFLRVDKNHQLWILGHTSGLLLFDAKRERIVERLVPDSTINSLRQSGVWVLLDLGDALLIGYDTHGISIYHKNTRQFEHITSNEGLAGNRVRDAFIDTDNTIWIATSNGITHFYPATKKCINYGQAEGIIESDINCITRLQDGRILAGTNKGFFVLDPKITEPLQTPPAPVLTAVSVLNNIISLDSLNGGKPLQLAYNENYVSFEFISPLYSKSRKVEYAYKLSGLNTDWIDCGNRRSISYANLPAGKYLFSIRCRLPGGQWIESRELLAIQIQAAFYNRWWFYLVIGLVIASLIAAAFRFRLHQLVKIEKVRNAISSDLHDEVGATLTSISIFSEMARKLTTSSSKEEEYLLRIGERSRDSIEKMSDIIWNINPNNDSLELMLVRMKNYTNEVAEAKNIATHWKEEGDLLNAKISMENRKNIYLFFKEVVNNAVKHSNANNISILLQSSKSKMRLCITDDGKGFDITEIKSGNGLKNIKKRATSLNGKVEIITHPNSGTVVELTVPY